tara:strand:+ start:713 stop:1303 length:591 start_codon:yes stop_codon:yes gene_type:complete
MKRRIIWRRDPTTDIPTEKHSWGKYYGNGTYQYFRLFASKAKIRTFKALYWHLRVLWYLNPQMGQNEFNRLVEHMCDENNGFVLFTIPKYMKQELILKISLEDLEEPPNNALRKIVFKEYSGLTKIEKQQVVGAYSRKGSGVSPAGIYDAMLQLNEDNEKITINRLAAVLSCTKRTIHRNMDDALRREKQQLNADL